MQVGCYTLDLYCDNMRGIWTCFYTRIWEDDAIIIKGRSEMFPTQYTDELGSRCRSLARKDGWTLSKDKTICPECNRKED